MTVTAEAVEKPYQDEQSKKPYVVVYGSVNKLVADVTYYIHKSYQPTGGPILISTYDHENHPIFAQALVHISIVRRTQ